MTQTSIREDQARREQPKVDFWLRFARPVQHMYDLQNRADRIQDLRSAILVGLVLYNVYNFTSFLLLRNSFELSVALRLGLVTPFSLALSYLIGKTSPLWTERLVTLGILNAYLVPVFLFWETTSPLGAFTFGELALTIIFANMLLALRFRYAVLFTAFALAATLLAIATKDNLDASLKVAFAIQIATACAFGIYANYRLERRRCSDYLTALEAIQLAEEAAAARQQYHDLSRTDVLTGLPNRRHMSEVVEGWLSGPQQVALMMIDIDHFKLYNDALGHPAGDECLQKVSTAFATLAYELEHAFCARFGGEEFTFILRDADELSAARCAKALLQVVTALQIPHPSRPNGSSVVTVSIGVSLGRGNHPATSLSSLVASADAALYEAKRLGRSGFFMDGGRPGLERCSM